MIKVLEIYDCFFKKKINKVIIYFIFLVIIALLGINIEKDFKSLHEDNGAAFFSSAYSHIKLGIKKTHFMDYIINMWSKKTLNNLFYNKQDTITYVIKNNFTDFYHYYHHPPGIGLSLVFFIKIFGYKYWGLRLLPIFYYISGLLLFYFLLKYLKFDYMFIFFTLLILAFLPIGNYFGRNICHESPGLFWGMFLLYNYFKFISEKNNKYYLLLFIGTLLGAFYGWSIYILIFFITLSSVLLFYKKDNKLLTKIFIWQGWTIMIFMLFILYLLYLQNWNINTLISVFKFRAGISDNIGFIKWILKLKDFFVKGFTPIVVFLILISIIFITIEWNKLRNNFFSNRRILFFILLFWGLFYIILFRNGSYIHIYWQFYLIPSVAMLSAYALKKIFTLNIKKVYKLSIFFSLISIFIFEGLKTLYQFHHWYPISHTFGTSVWGISFDGLVSFIKSIL